MRGSHPAKAQLSLHPEFLPEQRLEFVPRSLKRVMDGTPFGSRQGVGAALGKGAVRVTTPCSADQRNDAGGQPAGFLDFFQRRSFGGLAGREAQKLAAVEKSAALRPRRVDRTPALSVGRAGLEEKFSPSFPFDLQTCGREGASGVASLQHNRMKENSVAAHAACGAEPGRGRRELIRHVVTTRKQAEKSPGYERRYFPRNKGWI
jgi:hypothetical protein